MNASCAFSKITALLAALLLAAPRPAAAQISATLTGRVSDPAAAAVVGAEVTVTNLESLVKLRTVTSETGTYRVVSPPPGVYRVEIVASGFKKFVKGDVLISTGTTTTLEAQLELGAVTEQVTVSGTTPLLSTEDATLGTVVERKMIEHLPVLLNTDQSAASGRRQPTTFINLTPGVGGTEYNKQVNGMQRFTTEVDVEGGPIESPNRYGTVGNVSPPYDAVEEFNVVSAIPNAEDGNGASSVKLTLKSGTNQFHGSAFEYLRNDVFDARSFFARTVPMVRQNEYGFTVGGPVVLPKLYQGRNKTFFFFALNQFKVRGGGTAGIATMPTTAMKQGDFSRLADNQGNLIPIFDPASAPNDGQSLRTQFPGNIIPASRIDPRAKKFADYLPTPTIDVSVNNLIGATTRITNDTVYSIKIDHNFSEKHRLSGSYWWARADIDQYRNCPGVTNDGYTIAERGRGLSINYMWVASPFVTNEARFGFTVNNSGGKPLPGNAVEPNPLNLTNYPLGDDGRLGINISGYGRTGFMLYHGNPTFGTPAPSTGIRDTLTWVKGNHTIKTGFDINRRGYGSDGLASVYLTFSRFQTSQPASPNFNRWGDGFASTLLGDVHDQGSQQLVSSSRSLGRRYSWFIQDGWKVTPKLVLTLGLRYDLAPAAQMDGGLSSFDPTMPNPGANGRPGALRLVSSGGFYDTRFNNLGPRFGFAYRMKANTVLRAGYALIHQVQGGELFLSDAFRQGFTSNLAIPSEVDWKPVFNLWRGGLQVDPNLGKLPNTDPAQVNNRSVEWFHPSAARSTTMQQWTFSVQRQLPRNILAEARYVGWKAQGYYSSLDIVNQLDPRYWSLGSLLTSSVTSPAAAAAGIVAPYPGFNGTAAQALRAFPQYQTINTANHTEALAQAKHHSVQLQVQNRMTKSLLFLANYVFGKTISDTGAGGQSSPYPVDNFNRALEKAVQAGESPQQVKVTWVYELPFGTGRRWLNLTPRVVDLFVGGWNLAAAQAYSSGGYLTVGGGRSTPFFTLATRPDRVLGAPVQLYQGGKFDPAKDRYVNLQAFRASAPFTIGNAPRTLDDLRGFRGRNENVSLTKRFKIYERFEAELRGEFFNIFNRVIFGGPATDINNTGAFGTVTSTGSPRQMQFMLRLSF